jgi:ubiquinone/menaquinone biosynthesis C-methylase UbiE
MSGPEPDYGWWRHHFDADYHALHEPLFSEEASRQEIAAMRELLGLAHDARVLDVPCGWGRHTRLLADAGHAAIGADLSPALLARAQPPDHAAVPPYVAADIRALPFRSGSFDAVINVFTSLGLFLDDADDIDALREARRLLQPGGRFLLESMHRDEVVAAYAERDRWALPDGTQLVARRRFDPITGISHERLRWRRAGERGEKRHALRLRTATEIAGLLRAAGFEQVRYYGDWDGTAFRHDSERLIAVAEADARG